MHNSLNRVNVNSSRIVVELSNVRNVNFSRNWRDRGGNWMLREGSTNSTNTLIIP